MEPRVGNKFRLGRKIGSGSFGEIYLGIYFSSSSSCFFLNTSINSVFLFCKSSIILY
jgi:hypothetical protein